MLLRGITQSRQISPSFFVEQRRAMAGLGKSSRRLKSVQERYASNLVVIQGRIPSTDKWLETSHFVYHWDEFRDMFVW